jgi:hypothetical protein
MMLGAASIGSTMRERASHFERGDLAPHHETALG